MNSKPPSWRDTLSRYLEASNEDSQVVSYFEQSIAPKIRTRENLIWLDIGPGPGTKTFGIYKALLDVGIHVTQAQAIDPDLAWRSEFLSRAKAFSHCFPCARQLVLNSASLHDLNQPRSTALRFREPNFMTCIHVLYEASLVEDFGTYLADRSGYCAWVVVESSSSALWQMRKTINETLGISIPLESEHAIRRMLTDRKIKYRDELITGETCQIRSADDIGEWLLPFLLGVSHQDIGNIDQQILTTLTELVEEYVAKQNWVLPVPDVAFHLENY
jgi:hypothetical protein